KEHVFHDTYSNLAAIEPHLPQVWAISKRRKQITPNIAKLVPISIIDIQTQAQVDLIEEPDITEIDIHVLITFAILDDLENIHKPEYYYTIVLYSGDEDYFSLKNSTRLLNNELHKLSNNSIVVNNNK
ncbi:16318_t:CDS:2, partial [Gigaspora margarita]